MIVTVTVIGNNRSVVECVVIEAMSERPTISLLVEFKRSSFVLRWILCRSQGRYFSPEAKWRGRRRKRRKKKKKSGITEVANHSPPPTDSII